MDKRRKELIIQSICSMNTEMLHVLLDESRTYDDADVDTFIEKLDEKFSLFRTLNLEVGNDTELIPYKGVCNHDDCPNKGCEGISFVGNKSKAHMDFIFAEDDDGNEIFQCNGFKTEREIVGKLSQIRISVKEHERADFNPSIDFLIQQQRCQLATGELKDIEEIIDLEIIEKWLAKHLVLFVAIDKNNRHPDFLFFCELFLTLEKVKGYIEFGPLAKGALIEYAAILPDDEGKIDGWLDKYIKLGWDRLSGGVSFFENLINVLVTPAFTNHGDHNYAVYLRIDSEYLNDLVKFDAIFIKHNNIFNDKLEALNPESSGIEGPTTDWHW